MPVDGLATHCPHNKGLDVIVRVEAIREMWHQRELLYFLAWRDVKVRYKQAALGMTWAIIQPLFTMITFTFFFGKLAGIPSDGVPYPLFSYSALVLWMYFSVTLSQAGNSLISNSNLITKVYFPRVFLPAASALAGILDCAIGFLFLIVMMVYYGIVPTWHILLAPVFVFQLVVLTFGISMCLAAMNVQYRDVKYTIPFITQLWLFVTPIIYPVTFVPEQYRWLLAFNPIAGIIEGFRASVLGIGQIHWDLVEMSWLITVLILVVGAAYFRSTERRFADIV